MSHRLNRLAKSLTFSLYKSTTHFLSLLLKNSLHKTLDFFFFMDSFLFNNNDDDDFFFGAGAADHTSSAFPSLNRLDDLNDDHLYLVNFRWWNEARECLLSEINGVSYTATHWEDFGDVVLDSEVVLDLQMDERSDDGGDHGKEVGFSGREYALIAEWMFLSALKWHNDIRSTGSSLAKEDKREDLFSLQIRLSLLCGTNSLVVKISGKDNDVGTFKKAYDIFYIESGSLRIWDFSGQTTQFFTNDRKFNNVSNQPNEILIELQVYGLSSYVKQMFEGDGEMRAEKSNIEDFHCSGSLEMNRVTSYEDSFFQVTPQPFASFFSETSELGLCGLHNLGNTCFMNSAIQCLAHTPKLNDYFLGNFRKDLNFENPLGMNGKLALAFGDLLRKLWAPGTTPVTPRMFKSVLSAFAPQFSGYNQHDSQEFLAFLLDGLHEDLNRVKCKPYIEVKDTDGYPDEELADECWRNHLARNDSIIVDMFQGQYRSTLVCPLCKKLSITFDPFMYLSLPLPSTRMRTMTLTVVSTAGTTMPIPVTVTVPKYGRLNDLIQVVSTSCSLGEDETLLVAEIYNNRILRFLDKPSDSDSIELIRDNDQLVAYRFFKASDESPLVVFMHQREKFYFQEPSMQRFGIPLVARLSDFAAGSELHKKFLELLNPFIMPDENSVDASDDGQNAFNQDTGMADAINTDIFEGDTNRETRGISLEENGFKFFLEDKDRKGMSKIVEDEPIPRSGSRAINVVVYWSDKMLQLYDTSRLSLLPEICGPFRTKPPESVSLYKCLEAFLKEEPLGPDDMWYCPNCKKHQQASKKLDLWRLPEILVIHLKRFSYNQFLRDKLETFVDFPVDEFDLSGYTVQKGGQVSSRYKLYAVSNHYGSMGGGHYTAFGQHGAGRWFDFDDSRIYPVHVEQIKTYAAYVLFYRRISDV